MFQRDGFVKMLNQTSDFLVPSHSHITCISLHVSFELLVGLESVLQRSLHLFPLPAQGIQTGRLTLAEVLAQQEILIAEVVENYRKHSLQKNNQEDESVQVGFSLWLISVGLLKNGGGGGDFF